MENAVHWISFLVHINLTPRNQYNYIQEEAYLREAIKASLETEAQRKGGEDNASNKPKISAEATDLLIDFMDDFDAGGWVHEV